jgi:hypothetical protein
LCVSQNVIDLAKVGTIRQPSTCISFTVTIGHAKILKSCIETERLAAPFRLQALQLAYPISGITV